MVERVCAQPIVRNIVSLALSMTYLATKYLDNAVGIHIYKPTFENLRVSVVMTCLVPIPVHLGGLIIVELIPLEEYFCLPGWKLESRVASLKDGKGRSWV